MSKLLPVVLFSLFLAVLSHKHSGYDYINGVYYRKERLFYTIMSIVMILFVGLRTYYNDTTTYLIGYNRIEVEPGWQKSIEWSKIGSNPGFIFAQSVLKELNASENTFLLVFAVFTVGTTIWFYRKYSCNFWITILLFFSISGYTFHMAAIKQCTAMTFCLLATDRAINKKYVQFVIFVLLGSLFHPYALMYLIVPFLFFRPWSRYTLILLLIFGLIGVSLEGLLGTLLNVTDMLGENYNSASFMGEGINPIRLLVVSVPSVLALIVKDQIGEKEERDQYLIMNLTMLNAEIMFVALFGTANYFGRLANYFVPFQALSIPWLLKHFDRRGKGTMTFLAVSGYTLYFIYSQAINERFDACFYGISLWDYLKDCFGGFL